MKILMMILKELGTLFRFLTKEVVRFTIYSIIILLILRNQKGVTELVDSVTPFFNQGYGEFVSELEEEISGRTLTTSDATINNVAYADTINKVAKEYDLDPAMIATIIQIESGYNPNAVSSAGAMGIAQIMPPTWEWLCSDMADPFNAVENIECSGRVLRYLSDYYNGDEMKIVSAYNAGAGNVDANGGRPLPGENTLYVNRYKSNYGTYELRTTVIQDVVSEPSGWSIYGDKREVYRTGSLGWHEGARDLTGGCGAPLFAPIEGVVSMRYDGHIGPYGSNNSEIKIENSQYRLTILHLKFNEDISNGENVERGRLIGAEDSIGNSTHCHSHVIWYDKVNRTYLDPYASVACDGGRKYC